MVSSAEVSMDSAVCPACAIAIPKRNKGCPHCHYSFAENLHGRVGTLREVLATQAGHFNNVSPAFLRVLAQAARLDGLAPASGGDDIRV